MRFSGWRQVPPYVRMPIGGTGGSLILVGGGTGSAGRAVGSGKNTHKINPEGLAALGAKSPRQPSFQSPSPPRW
jgi:hypothetical protein